MPRGATWISDLHDWVRKYVSAFGLVLEPLKPNGRADVVHVRGVGVVVRDERSVQWPLRLTAEEQRLGIAGMRAKYIASVFDEIGDAAAPEAPPSRLARFDAMSYATVLERQGASPDARLLLTLGTGSNENHLTSALMRFRAGVSGGAAPGSGAGSRAATTGFRKRSRPLWRIAFSTARLSPRRRELEAGTSYSWDEDPWAKGAFAQPRPGQLIDVLTVLRDPVRRIVFAGDHASAWPAWMHGALESGNHAARLIDAAT